MSFCKSQFPHNSIDLFFMLVIVKDKLKDLWGNWLLQNEPWNTSCEIRPRIHSWVRKRVTHRGKKERERVCVCVRERARERERKRDSREVICNPLVGRRVRLEAIRDLFTTWNLQARLGIQPATIEFNNPLFNSMSHYRTRKFNKSLLNKTLLNRAGNSINHYWISHLRWARLTTHEMYATWGCGKPH